MHRPLRPHCAAHSHRPERAPLVPCSELYEQFVKVATEEQLARFEQFKRSKFPRATMKKLMGDLVGNSSERCAIALVRPAALLPQGACPAHRPVHTSHTDPAQASLAKTLVGELVESAKQEMTANGQSGPLQPYHLRQAYRRAQQCGSVPASDTGMPSLFHRRDCGP